MSENALEVLREADSVPAVRGEAEIVIEGRSLCPRDVEATLDTCHPALRPGRGAAVGVDLYGAQALAVVCEVRSAEDLPVDETIDAIRRAVSEAHRVEVRIIRLLEPGSIPRTLSGRVQRHACQQGVVRGTLHTAVEWLLR